MWEYEYIYLQYFSHSLAVTVASRVAVAVVSQVSYRVITYYIVRILSCRHYNLNGKKFSSSTLSAYYQIFSVFSLAALHVTQNSFVYILKIIGAEMEEKLVQWNPGLTINNLLPAQKKLQ